MSELKKEISLIKDRLIEIEEDNSLSEEASEFNLDAIIALCKLVEIDGNVTLINKE